MQTVVGIDVGGSRKGFHAVSLADGGQYETLNTPDADRLATWCRERGAITIAIDAPCCWSPDGRMRSAERELARRGISCFSTPTRAAAVAHPKNYFGWMLAGERLFEALGETHPRYDDSQKPGTPVCLETFPQAVACTLAGRVVSAREKTTIRRQLLVDKGVDISRLTNIDLVDAMLCALTARAFEAGAFTTYGVVDDGFIVVPTG